MEYFNQLRKSWEKTYTEHGSSVPWAKQEYLDVFVPTISGLIKKYHPKANSALDYGTGTGQYAVLLKRELGIYTVVAADLTDKGIDKTLFEKHKIKFVCSDTPNDVSGTYDVILCWGVFHCIEPKYHEQFLSQFAGMLNAGGVIILGSFAPDDSHLAGQKVKKSTFSNRDIFHVKIIDDNNALAALGMKAITRDNIGLKRTFRYAVIKAK